MRLVTYNDGQVGRLAEDRIIQLDCGSTREFFERAGAVRETGESVSLAEARLKAPLVPKKFFHTAGNFREHGDELARANWSHSVNRGIVFFQNVDAIIGPEEPVIYPEHLTNELDYEIELAIIIGKGGKFFSSDQAMDYVAGYTVFNDITARDIQRREMLSGVFSFCKAIDTFCPLGPWIVTADEIQDPHALTMELRVNGEVRQHSNTSRMSLSIAELVAYHSPQVYSPGDIITTGTIGGIAAAREDPFAYYLKPGDLIEAEIGQVGILRTPVISWLDGHGSELAVEHQATHRGDAG